jgi:hypothetical protein
VPLSACISSTACLCSPPCTFKRAVMHMTMHVLPCTSSVCCQALLQHLCPHGCWCHLWSHACCCCRVHAQHQGHGDGCTGPRHHCSSTSTAQQGKVCAQDCLCSSWQLQPAVCRQHRCQLRCCAVCAVWRLVLTAGHTASPRMAYLIHTKWLSASNIGMLTCTLGACPLALFDLVQGQPPTGP